MPQITQLDNDPTPNNNDLLVTVDMAAGTTKNISREQFFTGAPLPADTVNLQAINGGTTAGTLVTNASGDVSVVSRGNSAFAPTGTTSVGQSYTAVSGAPAVTVNIGVSGSALVSIKARLGNNTANSLSFASFAVSGATTRAGSDDTAIASQAYAANSQQEFGATFLVDGLNPGSNTFTLVNKTDGNTGQYSRRYIAVVPL